MHNAKSISNQEGPNLRWTNYWRTQTITNTSLYVKIAHVKIMHLLKVGTSSSLYLHHVLERYIRLGFCHEKEVNIMLLIFQTSKSPQPPRPPWLCLCLAQKPHPLHRLRFIVRHNEFGI